MNLIDETQAISRINRPQSSGFHAITVALIVALFFPIDVTIADIRLSPYRIILLAITIPACLIWIGSKAINKTLLDVIIIFVWLASSIALVVNHGLGDMIQPIGINFLETVGAYLWARISIRKPEHLLGVAQVIFRCALVLLPFALYENLTGENAALSIVRLLGPGFGDVPHEERWGLDRAQGIFDHPILLGVFYSGVFSLCYLCSTNRPSRWRASIAALGTFSSLSSGPLLGLFAQIGLIIYDRFINLRKKWMILLLFALLLYVMADLLSNRTPAELVAGYLSFNSATAYGRIYIWRWGWINMENHPMFGIGFNDWERAYHMTSSIDMFFMANGVKYGIIVFSLTVLAPIIAIYQIGKVNCEHSLHDQLRRGLMFSLVGWFVIGWSVHFWNSTYVLYLFILGMSMCFLNKNRR